MENWPKQHSFCSLLLSWCRMQLSMYYTFFPFCFLSNSHKALSHIIPIPQNLSLSLFIFRPISSTHASRILYFGQNWPKQPGTLETHCNRPKFDPRWNRGDYCSSLYAGTKFSSHFDWNGTELITMHYITNH